jgi:hypothetical protein
VQKWINEISQLGEKATCSEMVNNDLIEAFSTVTETDDCSLNWPTPEYEKKYVEAYQDKISKAYQKYKPEQLRKLAGSVLQTNTQGKDAKSVQQRLFKLLLQRQINGGSGIDNSIAEAAHELAEAEAKTEVHYVRMTAEEYLRRIKANLGEDCEVPRWPCCNELLRKLEEEALAKQLAEQATPEAPTAPEQTSTEPETPTPTESTPEETTVPAPETPLPESPETPGPTPESPSPSPEEPAPPVPPTEPQPEPPIESPPPSTPPPSGTSS